MTGEVQQDRNRYEKQQLADGPAVIGALERLPVAVVSAIPAALERLRARGDKSLDPPAESTSRPVVRDHQ